MIGRVFLQALEQDAISSKKIINRMMKLRGDNRGAENLSEDELQKEYKKSVEAVDKILDDFYSGNISFDGENGLLTSLQKIGVLEEDGSLKSNVALQKAVEFIHKQSGGDSFLKKIFGDDISFDDKDLGTDKYYFAQNLSSQGIKNVFGDIYQMTYIKWHAMYWMNNIQAKSDIIPAHRWYRSRVFRYLTIRIII